MSKRDNDFQKKLLATFKVEAEEHIRAMSSGLLDLEKAPAAETQVEIVETIFREAHSLKGAARAVNLTEIETVCQSLESVFAALKRKQIAPSPELLDTLHQTVDGLGQLLAASERTTAAQPMAATLVRQLDSALKTARQPPQRAALKEIVAEAPVALETDARVPGSATDKLAAAEKPMLSDSIRISTAKLDSLLLQAEELLSAKLSLGQRATELREINAAFVIWKKEWGKIYPVVRALQESVERNGDGNGKRSGGDLQPAGPGKKNPQLWKLLEFLEWNSIQVKSLEHQLTALTFSIEHDQRSLAGMVDNLLDDMKQVLTLPIASLLETFPKMVRDLSRDRSKEVELKIQGAEIEIDRRILEEMKDPLIHLVRNCIDHGIEAPALREQKKKPPRGTIVLAVSPKNGSKVEILISDDGAGIDAAKVRSAALKLGIVPPEAAEKPDEQDALSLIFQSGVSTSPIITDISGHGLGLAIVREKVEKLGGAVALETQRDVGTIFRIVLPLTLATFRGLLVRVEEQLFVLPTANVERAVRVTRGEIKTVENRETIRLNGQAVPLVRLGDALQVPRKSAAAGATDQAPVVILGSAEKRIAFLVDAILYEQEVLVKNLGPQLARVRNIAGATVLGTGKVVPILNIPDVMKSAVKTAAAPSRAAAAAKETAAKRKSILVVEDSITARTLLKNILEAAGYTVKTAVDGMDAFTTLRTEEFDLVVSDVDMPRMNGFDLTAKIRGDKKLAEVPVVLVTALQSRDDRERGIDVGANAYIVKSSFDQSNLLEVIRKLV